jgi:hypothetical protein
MAAAEAWLAGEGEKAQALSQPILDDAPTDNSTAEEIPGWLKNHQAIEQIHENQNARLADDPAAAEAAMISHAATVLTELGSEGQALLNDWGGANSPAFKENFAYAKSAFADIAKNRPHLIAKVDASGLGNDPAVLQILSELGRQKANTYGDTTVSSRFQSNGAPLPSGNSAAQRELNRIFEETPPGSPGYAKPAVQQRIWQLQELIHGRE